MFEVLGSTKVRLGNSFLSALVDLTYFIELHVDSAICVGGDAIEQYNADGLVITDPPFPSNNKCERSGGGGGGTSDETLVDVPAQLLVPAVSQTLSPSVELSPNLLR